MSEDDDALRKFLSMVKVGTEEECEQASCVVCVLKEGAETPFDDNVTARCVMCEQEVIHRPYAPEKPPKVCFGCLPAFLDKMKAEESGGEE